MMAFPATISAIQFQAPKKSFANWFIQDYLITQILQKTSKEENEVSTVSYDLKADLTPENDSVFNILNNITGYNHLMTYNEQIVKNDMRLKFILESLTIL